MVILFSTKCFLFVYMFIVLLKLKAYKLFENIDADLSWLLFQRSQLDYLSFNIISVISLITHIFLYLLGFTNTVKPVLKTTCIKRPPALKDNSVLIQQRSLHQFHRTSI